MSFYDANDSDRLQSPSTARNAEHIYDVLKNFLPSSGTVLEVACGSGEHGVAYAPRVPHLKWQPSDRDETALKSVQSWRQFSDIPNLLAPVKIDLTDLDQQVVSGLSDVTAIMNANMIHISPWEATLSLLALAQKLLPKDAPLYLYGPYKREGQHTADSNIQFDSWLKSQDKSWGVRDLEALVTEADRCGLILAEVIEMPSNNFSVIFLRR